MLLKLKLTSCGTFCHLNRNDDQTISQTFDAPTHLFISVLDRIQETIGGPGWAHRMVADAFEGFRDRHVNSI